MNSTTETNSPQATHHTMEGDQNDQIETGDVIRGADTESWTETDHGIENGQENKIAKDAKRIGAKKEMIVTIGIEDGVRRDITAGADERNKMKDGERMAVVMREVKLKGKKRTNDCLKG